MTGADARQAAKAERPVVLYANTPFDALRVGMTAEVRRLCVADDLYVFANASGNVNPLHLPEEDGDLDGVPEAIAPAMWLGALISGVLGNRLPGPGTVYKSQTLRFLGSARVGDEVTAGVRLKGLREGREAVFETWVDLAEGKRIVEGEAVVTAPERAQTFEAGDVPGLTVRSHLHFDRLLARAEPLDPIPTAVVVPEETSALAGAMLAARHTLIVPILVGSPSRIAAVADAAGLDLGGVEVVEAAAPGEAAARACALVHEGRARAVMKGHLHTDVLLRAILKRQGGLTTGRRLSHVFVMDVPGLSHLVLVTDAAINIAPDLEAKIHIVQNAIHLALALGIPEPKAGILSAVETVNPNIPSTLDAAILSKMAERGQITGGLVDGPLAMDNAVDIEAARTKGIKSLVAGRADILVAPNLEAGNMIAKELTFLAHAEAGGVVVGAQVPIILSSRADDDKARLASCAVAALYANRAR